MRVPDEAALGEATVAVRVEGWPEGQIFPSIHRIPVVARKPLQQVKVSPQARDVWAFDGYAINELRYTPDGKSLLVVLHKSLKDGHLFQFRLWDVASGKERAKVLQIDPEPLKIIYSPYLAISSDGKLLAIRYNLARYTKVGKNYKSQENGVIHVIDLENGRQLWTHEGDDLGIYGTDFSPDGRTLVTGHTHCKKTVEDGREQRVFTGTVKFWDAASGREKEGLPPGHIQLVWDVQFSPDGNELWISDEHREKSFPSRNASTLIQVWDIAAKKRRLQLGGFSRVAYSPEGAHLAVSDAKGDIKVFDSRSELERSALSLNLDKRWIIELLWSADGKYLFLASTKGELWRWEWASQQRPIKVESILSAKGQLDLDAWPQHGNLSAGLYAFGVNGKISKRITQRTLEEDYAELPPPKIVLWDTNSMQRRATLTGHQGQINCLAISPDGKTLVSGGTDGTIRTWDIASPPP